MKKRMFLLLAMLVLLLTVSVQAAEMRTISGKPSLFFDGITAHCSAVCTGEGSNDQVDATITLYQESTYVDSWTSSGKGRVSVSGSRTVKSGKRYKLTLTYSINGAKKPSVSTIATCP